MNDWKHFSDRIKSHEKSALHLQNYATWKAFCVLDQNEKSIQNQLNKQIQDEKNRLRDVFKRLVAFILYFARQNIALTGTSSNIYDPSGKNGNFQQLIHTVSEFDPVLKNHLEKIQNFTTCLYRYKMN